MRTAGNTLAAISGTFALASIKMARGRLREAVSTYEQSLRLATERGQPVLRGTADLYVGLSELHHEQGDLETATKDLLKSEELGEQATLPKMQYRSRAVVEARMKQSQGDLAGALDLLHKAERLYIRGPVPDVRPVTALKTRVWVSQGRVSEALSWTREQGLSVDDDLSYLREFEHITLVRVLIAEYKNDRLNRSILEAMRLLERLLQAAEEGGRMGSVIEILGLQALAHEAQGNIPLALAPLERALALAEPEGYIRIFVDEGIPMVELLTRLKSYQGRDEDETLRMKAYIHKLLAVFGQGKPPALSPQPLIEPLSQRELEVLHLIAQGLSNREISERLFLALDTVKGHNRRIYSKLEVQRRTEAVARARELGLL